MTASSSLGLLLLAQQTSPDSWTTPINGLIVSLALIISAIGVALIVWGAYSSVLRLIAAETGAVRGQGPRAEAPGAMPFAAYLVPGLDFMIAGTVIKTLAVSDWQQAALLTGLVLVRTLLGLSMKWEAAAVGTLATSPSVREHLTPPPRFSEGGRRTADDPVPADNHAVA